MAAQVPNAVLSNGAVMPLLGLGTWRAQPGEVKEAVKYAIDVGYRHFDCALFYENEAEIGSGIKEKIDVGFITRKELFITSKLWCNTMRPDLVESTLRKSLENLGIEYLDLYLIHWPIAFKEGNELYPKDDAGRTIFSDVDYVDTWKAMEEIYKKGLAKVIGISNFNIKQVKRLLEYATIKPMVNQIECHLYLQQTDLLSLCKSHNIAVTGYSPLGSRDRPWATKSDPSVLEDPTIKTIAQKYKKTPAQVILRFLIQQDVIPIPKSCNKERIKENINIFDFYLDSTDMNSIRQLNSNMRYHYHLECKGHKNYPFDEE